MNASADHHIESRALSMSYFAVPWDSEAFGFCVGQIDSLQLGTGDPGADFARFEQWCRDEKARLVSCRLPHDRLRESAWLESRGFRFIEMVYQPRLELRQATRLERDDLRIAPVATGDLAAIEEIAGTAFTTSRFLLDPELERGLSGRRYRRWVRTSFANPSHQVLKAEIDGSIAGFFVIEERSDATAYWHLTAISPAFQRRGIGKALWRAMLARHRDAGLRAVETTVSAHNTPVLNLYAQLGFRLQPGGTTLHRTGYR